MRGSIRVPTFRGTWRVYLDSRFVRRKGMKWSGKSTDGSKKKKRGKRVFIMQNT